MSYYETCPECGAHLDPGEKCDCAPVFTSIEAVARRWSVSRDTVYRLVRTGALPSIRLCGTTWRIPVDAVKDYETKCIYEPGSTAEVKHKAVLKL